MKHRLQFAGKKLIRMLLLLLGVSLAAFLLMSASPLDPLQTNVGQAALGTMSQEQIAQLEDYWGVNTPLPERYLGWLFSALRGDSSGGGWSIPWGFSCSPGSCPAFWASRLGSSPEPCGAAGLTG